MRFLQNRPLVSFTLILILIQLFVYRDFVFGDYYFMYSDVGSDSYLSGYPKLYSKIEFLKHNEIPGLSFTNGLGENLYPFWLEPVSIGICYFFFQNDVAGAMIWIHLVYATLGGIFFFLFLRGFRFHFYSATFCALLFVFSGYLVVHSTWYHLEFGNSFMLLSFLLFAWQQFVFQKKWYWFPLPVVLMAISSPINLYFGALIIGLFMILIAYTFYAGNVKSWFIDLAKLLVLGLIGLGISCFLLLSNLDAMRNSPRGTGEYVNSNLMDESGYFAFADVSELKTSFLRLFSPNLEGGANEFTGWQNYFEAPMWYCGLIVLLLIPQLFGFVSKRQKILIGCVLAFFFLVAIFPKLRILLWFNSGNYYRLISLMLAFILLFLAAFALDRILRNKQIFPRTLWISCGILLLALFLAKDNVHVSASPGLLVIGLFLSAFAGALYYGAARKNHLVWILGIGIFLEINVFTSPTLYERRIVSTQDIKPGAGFFDASFYVIRDINNQDKDFFRLEKDFFSGNLPYASFNEARIQNFNGGKTYNSFANIHYINFLRCIGELPEVNEASTRWVYGIANSPAAMRLCSVRYFLSKRYSFENYPADFQLISQHQDVRSFELLKSMPFGFTYDVYIHNDDFQRLSYAEKQKRMLQAVVLDPRLMPEKNFLNRFDAQTPIEDRVYDSISNPKFEHQAISGNLASRKNQILFFSIPYEEGWKLTLNGKEHELIPVFQGLMGAFISKGDYRVTLKFEDSKKFTGMIVTSVFLLIYLLLIYFVQLRKLSFFEKK